MKEISIKKPISISDTCSVLKLNISLIRGGSGFQKGVYISDKCKVLQRPACVSIAWDIFFLFLKFVGFPKGGRGRRVLTPRTALHPPLG